MSDLTIQLLVDTTEKRWEKKTDFVNRMRLVLCVKYGYTYLINIVGVTSSSLYDV